MMDWARAYRVASDPASHSLREVEDAHRFLRVGGSPRDYAAVALLETHLESRSRFWRFAILVAVIAVLMGGAVFLANSLISDADREAVLRFIAPTAFETRPIEEIIEGARGRHE